MSAELAGGAGRPGRIDGHGGVRDQTDRQNDPRRNDPREYLVPRIHTSPLPTAFTDCHDPTRHNSESLPPRIPLFRTGCVKFE